MAGDVIINILASERREGGRQADEYGQLVPLGAVRENLPGSNLLARHVQCMNNPVDTKVVKA